MAERADSSRGMRWATASALTAVAATVLYDRLHLRKQSTASEEEAQFGSPVGRGRASRGPSRQSREAGHETTDANIRSLALTMLTAVTLMAAGLTGVFFMYGRFDKGNQAPNAKLTAQQRAKLAPPLPHLQADPYQDIDAVLMEQNRRLTTYGWNDPAHASAHIPIARAMQQVVGKPLDASANDDASGSPGASRSFPPNPAFNALDQQHKPANRIQGEGRPGSVAPSYTPKPGDAEPAK